MADKSFKSLEHVPAEKNLGCDPCAMPARPYFPTLWVDSKQMPEIDSWEVGKEYEIRIRVKMKSYSISDSGDKRSRADLSVEGYERKNTKSLT